ncbi:MAG: HAMP domain-containing histidine kinase [Planctomycetes bacterium]|nr:HAMP domain-containing histidine kinase [Planctomycetota bacterium]
MNTRILGALGSRLGRRVVLLFVISAMLPLAAIATYSLTQVSDQLVEEAHRRLHSSVKSLGMTTMERLLVLEADLQALVVDLDDDPSELDAVARRTERRLGQHFEGLQLVDSTTRKPVAHALAPLSGLPELDPEDLEHMSRGGTSIKVVANSDEREPASVYLVLNASAGPRTARLFAKARPDYLWGGDAFIPPDTELLVLGPKQEIVFSSAAGAAADDLRSALAESSRAGPYGWTRGDEEYVGAYWKLFAKHQFDTSWVFAHSQPTVDVLGTLHTFRRFFVLVVLLASGIVVLLSLVQIRRSLGPITQLDGATRKVAGGDFSVALNIHSGDEFEDLANRFNDMVRRLMANIARREQVEEELIEARDTAIAAAQKETEFVQNVSHELRTPMTSIRAYSEILRDYGDEDPATREEFLGIIVSESERLTRLIDQVLDFSKVHSNNVEWSLEDVRLDEVVLGAARALQPVASEGGVEVDTTAVETCVDATVDRDRIQQVMTNLISNAIKFGASGGRVEVRMRRDDDVAVIEVQDWGHGIDGDDKQVVFERFRQVSTDSMTDKPNGTGLGLAITRDIVEQHGGEILVESEVGEGATFRVTLPLLAMPGGADQLVAAGAASSDE